MKLMDLKNGAVLETRNGKRYLKVDKTLLDLKMNGSCTPLDEYTEDLKHKVGIDGWDIMRVNNDVDNGHECCNEAVRDITQYNIWTWERKEILSDKEKEYLNAVIKPFKDRVESIKKQGIDHRLYQIRIGLKGGNYAISPYFDADEKMYKGMEANRHYTLEELGL